MKPRKKTYVYRNRELFGTFNSLSEAAYATKTTRTAINAQLTRELGSMTRKGFIFTYEPLTEEEIQNLPMYVPKEEEKYKPRFNDKCKVSIDTQEFEVDCKDHQVFHLERSKQGRIGQLRAYIYQNLKYKWLTQPKKLTIMEKRFVDELLESL